MSGPTKWLWVIMMSSVYWTLDLPWNLVVVQDSVKIWSSHVCEQEWSNEIDRVLNHNECEIDNLPCEELKEPIFKSEISTAQINFDVMENWVNEPIIVNFQSDHEVNVEVFDSKFYVSLSCIQRII